MAGRPKTGADEASEIVHLRAISPPLEQRMEALSLQLPTLPDLKALLENSPDIITLMTPEGKLVFLNRTIPDLTLGEVVDWTPSTICLRTNGLAMCRRLRRRSPRERHRSSRSPARAARSGKHGSFP